MPSASLLLVGTISADERQGKAMKSLTLFLGLPSLTARIETDGVEVLSGKSTFVVASLLRDRRATARRVPLRLGANPAVPPSGTQARCRTVRQTREASL
jgi:hypothetical protein